MGGVEEEGGTARTAMAARTARRGGRRGGRGQGIGWFRGPREVLDLRSTPVRVGPCHPSLVTPSLARQPSFTLGSSRGPQALYMNIAIQKVLLFTAPLLAAPPWQTHPPLHTSTARIPRSSRRARGLHPLLQLRTLLLGLCKSCLNGLDPLLCNIQEIPDALPLCPHILHHIVVVLPFLAQSCQLVFVLLGR